MCLGPAFWVSKGLLFVSVFLFTLGGTAQAGNPDRVAAAGPLVSAEGAPPAAPVGRDAVVRLPDGRCIPQIDRRFELSALGTYVLESETASFGEVIPGTEQQLPGAIRIRVFSERLPPGDHDSKIVTAVKRDPTPFKLP